MCYPAIIVRPIAPWGVFLVRPYVLPFSLVFFEACLWGRLRRRNLRLVPVLTLSPMAIFLQPVLDLLLPDCQPPAAFILTVVSPRGSPQSSEALISSRLLEGPFVISVFSILGNRLLRLGFTFLFPLSLSLESELITLFQELPG